MASNDVRDILDVAPSTQQRPAKKANIAASKNQYAGMSKEVRGLMMGDGIAPVQVQEIQYKKKPKLVKRAQPWIREPFTNSARGDGLVLKHWWKSTVPHRLETPGSHGAPVTPAESKVEAEGDAKPPPAVQTNYPFAKFSTKPNIPEYNDAQYEANLVHSDWTKEETDYLIRLASDFDLRWLLIWDRYDYRPQETQEGGEEAAMQVTKQRSMEDLKSRYYHVAAKIMEITQPLAQMSVAEFDTHEKMMKFDPTRETTRKKLAEALMARSPEELREEEILLGELKRITDNEERFLEERRDLYRRLDFPVSHGSIAGFETSAGLQQLALTLASQERSKKQRRSLLESGGNATSPATAGNRDGAGPARGDQRSAAPGKPNKKGSAAAAAAQHRQLSARDEVRYGVAHHDRLSSGVSFRQSRIEKLVLAKSAAQAQKLHDALGELQIPVRAVMPTDRVCTRYEHLIREIHLLLDARKSAEKFLNEVKVLRAQKEARERKERGEPDVEEEKDSQMDLDGTNEASGGAAKGGTDANGDRKANADDDDDDDAEKGDDDADADEERRYKARSEDEDDEENDDEEDENEAEADVDDDQEEGGSEEGEEGEEGEDGEDDGPDVDNDDQDDDDGEELADGSDAEAEAAAASDEEQDQDENDDGGNEDGDVEVEMEEEDEEEEDEEGPDDDAELDVEEEEEGEDAGEDNEEEENEGESGAEDEAEEAAAPTKPHKRSASVLSSANSARSSKRTRR